MGERAGGELNLDNPFHVTLMKDVAGRVLERLVHLRPARRQDDL